MPARLVRSSIAIRSSQVSGGARFRRANCARFTHSQLVECALMGAATAKQDDTLRAALARLRRL